MSELNIEPVSDFILVEPIKQGQTAGGIAIPDGASTDPPKGRIIKAGPGRFTEDGTFIANPFRPGDCVYMWFAYQQPTQVSLSGKEYLMARARDVVAKFDPEKATTTAIIPAKSAILR